MCECCVAADRYYERPDRTKAHDLSCAWFRKPYGMKCTCGFFEQNSSKAPREDAGGTISARSGSAGQVRTG